MSVHFSSSRRRFLFTAAAITTAVPIAAAIPGPVHAGSPEVFSRRSAAINGYDPVAYFTQSAPVKGDAAHRSHWKGANWFFASAETKAMFDADPEKYAPQYGGYCAYAVSKGYTAKTDPDAWSVHEGKLYLNYSLNVRDLWTRDIPGHISSADANWPSVLN